MKGESLRPTEIGTFTTPLNHNVKVYLLFETTKYFVLKCC
jgi:hypothetical protein